MRITCLTLLAVSILGCSSGPSGPPETVVTGEVYLDGKLLTMGLVYLENEAGTQSGLGEISPQGQFRIPSAPLGPVKAAVRTTSHARFAGPPKTKGGKAITMGEREGTFIPVPGRYEDVATAKLTYTITKDAVLKIELTGGGK